MAHSVFISYSSQDKKVADAVCATLEHRKIRCWIAPRDVLSGIPYAEALIRAINESSIMVLVFSASSNDSPQVMREVERAVDKGLPIIPFRIEDVIPSKAMEYYLSAPHWLDAITPPLEKHLRKLADTVQVLLAEVEKPHAEKDEKEETTIKQETKTTTGKSRKGLYAAAGIVVAIVVAIAIIVGIVLAMGGSGDDEEGDIAGLAATTTPGGTTATTTPGETTTSTPPTTSGATPAGTTTTPAGSTATPSGTSTTLDHLSTQTSFEGEFTFSGEVHWYTFDAQAGDAVHIVLSEGRDNSDMNPWLGLLAPDGSVISERTDTWYDKSVQIDLSLPETGKYTIRVRDYDLGTGYYALSFSQLSQTSNPVTPGSIQGQLEFPGEVHWYTFEGNEGDAVYIVLSEAENSTSMDPWLGLLAPDGSVVDESTDTWYEKSVQIDCALPETGTYIIRVRDNDLVGGTYTLSFSMISN